MLEIKVGLLSTSGLGEWDNVGQTVNHVNPKPGLVSVVGLVVLPLLNIHTNSTNKSQMLIKYRNFQGKNETGDSPAQQKKKRERKKRRRKKEEKRLAVHINPRRPEGHLDHIIQMDKTLRVQFSLAFIIIIIRLV